MPPRRLIVLFDIDGTLMHCGGAGRRSLDIAFERVFGVQGAMKDVRLAGSTDRVIVPEAYAAAFDGKTINDDDITRVLDAYVDILAENLDPTSDGYAVLPGAEAIVLACIAAPHLVTGLATGNIERGAMLKLGSAGLAQHFEFGGYGSDAPIRADLVRAGMTRGQERAEAKWGSAAEATVVIGDTGWDVVAGHAAGAEVIGVLEGSSRHEELVTAGPDLVVDSLEDPALWQWLGLSPSVTSSGEGA